MNLVRKSLAVVCLFVVSANAVLAALPITAILEYQKASPNHVELTATKVVITPDPRDNDYQLVELHATIQKVYRTNDKLKVGDKIVVHWSKPGPNAEAAGDWAYPPKKGEKVQGFIKKDGKQFKPAAYSGSFEEVKAKG